MPSPPEIAAPANTLPPPETTTKFTIWPFTAWPRESSTSATSGFGNSVPGGAVWLLPETTDRDSAPGARLRMSDGERQDASSRSPEIRAIVEERTIPPSKAIVETIAPTRGAARLTRPEPASHHQSTRTREGYNPPMTSRTAALLVVLASAVSVCRPAPESRAPRERASAVAQQDTQDTAFAGTLAPVQRVRSFRPGVARPVLRHVETRAGASPGGGLGWRGVGVHGGRGAGLRREEPPETGPARRSGRPGPGRRTGPPGGRVPPRARRRSTPSSAPPAPSFTCRHRCSRGSAGWRRAGRWCGAPRSFRVARRHLG